VREGKLRADLFYRLNVFPIALPPLRERPDDIPLLAHAFLADAAARNGRATMAIARRAGRPPALRLAGNGRELRNVIERAVLVADGETIEPAHLPAGLGESGKP